VANTKSAKKAIRVSKRKAVFNEHKRVKINNALDAVRKLSANEMSKEEGQKVMSTLQKALDKAVKTKQMHKNTASRLKSRASKKLKVITK